MQRDIAVALSMPGEEGEVLGKVIDVLVHQDAVDCGCIFLADPESGEPALAAHRGLPSGFVTAMHSLPADTPKSAVLQVDHPVFTTYEAIVAETGAVAADSSHQGLRGVAVLPVFDQGEFIAALVMGSHVADDFSENTRSVFELATAQMGSALARLRAQKRSREHAARLTALLEATRVISSTLDYSQVLTVIAEQAAAALRCPICQIWEVLPGTRTCLLRGLHEADPQPGRQERVNAYSYELDEFPEDVRAIENDEAVEQRLSDPTISEATRADMSAWGEKTWLTAPILYGGEPLGLLHLIEIERERHFSQADIEFVRGLARHAADAMRNARLYRELARRSQRTGALLAASREISSSIALEDVLDAVAEAMASAVDAPECIVWANDHETGTRNTRSEYGRDAEVKFKHEGDVLDLAEYPLDRKILESGELLEEHVSDPECDEDSRQSMLELGEKSCLSVPLRFNEEPVGLLCLIDKDKERHYAAEERELLQALSEQAAVAIHNAQLHRRLEIQNQRLTVLQKSSRDIAASLDWNKVLELVSRRVCETLDCAECSIYEYDPATKEEVFLTIYEKSPREGQQEGLTGVRFKLDEFPAEMEALLAGRILEERLSDPDLDPASRQALLEWGDKTLLHIPLVFEGRLIGMMEIAEYEQERHFTSGEMDIARAIGDQAAVAIGNSRLHQAIAEQAVTDGLTQLYNHRHFYERLKQEIARARRHDEALSLLMIDIDDFKVVNDTWGHVVGDEVLRCITKILKSQTRDEDICARYGGEEFAVVLPKTPPAMDETGAAADPARVVAERIRTVIAAARWSIEGADEPVGAQVSIGIATFPTAATTMDKLVARADEALYEAKRRGKNRVAVYEP